MNDWVEDPNFANPCTNYFRLWGDIPKYHLSLLHIQMLEFPNSLSLSCQQERRDLPHPV
jgi:hypothetical protein